jgi:ATP-binding protein involved in chromosome partitioning
MKFFSRKEDSLVNQEQVLAELRKIQDPDLHRDVVTLGFIKNLRIEGGDVTFDFVLTTPACPAKDQMRDDAVMLLSALPGVSRVNVNMQAEVKQQPSYSKNAIAGVKNVVAICSGKGGVGKSTVAVNLAAAMAQMGAAVGLLDADIYGPTIPIMLGRRDANIEARGNLLLPIEAHNMRFMSMGLMAPGDKPLIWRGPMAHKALQQTLLGVEWGNLDYLFIDLPPGTGDVHLTLVQSISVTGAVLVSTPQDVGLTISMKTYRMFVETNVKILGIIENMSYYLCSHCGSREEIFGHGIVSQAAEKLGIPFLGELPLDKRVREFADSGQPIVLGEPESASSKSFFDITRKLAAQISITNFNAKPLEIEEEPAETT